MKRLLAGSALALLPALMSLACAATVTVTVKNAANRNGSVRGLICDKEHFLKSCANKVSVHAAGGEVVLVFSDVPAGRYAVSVYHDENDNNKLDRNFIGIPSEGYGFSRDAKGHRGPPGFDDAAFDVRDGANELAVTLNY